MIVAMCCTRNWYIYLLTSVYALLKHNDVKKIYLFIEDDTIPYLTDKRITYINVNGIPEYITPNSPNYKTKYTKLSYTRCYFSKLIKCDKILYVDVDALVIDDIKELWNMDFENKVLIGTKEPGEWSKHLGIDGMDDKYINSGVLLMNLKAIREQKLDDKMIQLLNTKWYCFPDQDVINIVCKDKIKYVSNIYNSTETTGMVDNAKIIHYIRERKGWVKGCPRSEVWFNYHNEMIGGLKMEKCRVRATITFNDVESGVNRQAKKSEWICSVERYQYLKNHNAVELLEIIKEEEPKVEATVTSTEEPKTPKVEFKPTTKPKKKKTSKK